MWKNTTNYDQMKNQWKTKSNPNDRWHIWYDVTTMIDGCLSRTTFKTIKWNLFSSSCIRFFLEPIFDLNHFSSVHDNHGGIKRSKTYLDYYFYFQNYYWDFSLFFFFSWRKKQHPVRHNRVIKIFSILLLLFHWYVSLFIILEKYACWWILKYPNSKFLSYSFTHTQKYTRKQAFRQACTLSIEHWIYRDFFRVDPWMVW